jgi:hypothetical protein
MEPAGILAEMEEVFRTMPPRATIRHDTPENLSWIGRALAVLALWRPEVRETAHGYVQLLHDAGDTAKGYLGLMSLLNEARADLRLETIGPASIAIGQGAVFDYFDLIRKLIEEAKRDILFVDPYLDADFVSRYLPHVGSSIAVRLLAREKLATLIPAATTFAQQRKDVRLELRSAPSFHDRYLIIDGNACYQSGASFKDGARTAPTTITQITDAFSAVRDIYEKLWKEAKPEQL